MTRKCNLYSKLNYPVTIKYGKDSIIVPPFARNFLVEDTTKLGILPSGIRKIDVQEGGK